MRVYLSAPWNAHLHLNLQHNKRTYPFTVRQTDTIEDVKRQILHIYPDLGYPKTLFWAGRELENNDTISYYNMADGTPMRMILSKDPPQKPALPSAGKWRTVPASSLLERLLSQQPIPPKPALSPVPPRNGWGIVLPEKLASQQLVPQGAFAPRPTREQPTPSTPLANSLQVKPEARAVPTEGRQRLIDLMSGPRCDECGQVFPSANGLKKHRRIVHGFKGDFFPGRIPPPPALSPGRKPLPEPASFSYSRPVEKKEESFIETKCDMCGVILPSINAFKKHRRKVHNFRGDGPLPQHPRPRARSSFSESEESTMFEESSRSITSKESSRYVPYEPPSLARQRLNTAIRTECSKCGKFFNSMKLFKKHRRRRYAPTTRCEGAVPVVEAKKAFTGKEKSMRIFIKLPPRHDEREIALNVLPSHTIGDLKRKLYDMNFQKTRPTICQPKR
jgi:Ubiquitin family/zinc-finger C2H2-type